MCLKINIFKILNNHKEAKTCYEVLFCRLIMGTSSEEISNARMNTCPCAYYIKSLHVPLSYNTI